MAPGLAGGQERQPGPGDKAAGQPDRDSVELAGLPESLIEAGAVGKIVFLREERGLGRQCSKGSQGRSQALQKVPEPHMGPAPWVCPA